MGTPAGHARRTEVHLQAVVPGQPPRSQMKSREDILQRIRANQPAPMPLPELPALVHPAKDALLARFKAGVARMGGKVVEARGPLDGFLRHLHPTAKVVASAT